jgi:hypothetical protein
MKTYEIHSKIEDFLQHSKFSQSSIRERFGSESGRIQLFDIFNAFNTV